jgi:hypothetical protein
VVSSCGQGNGASDSIKGEEFVDHLRDYRLLRKDSVPRSELIICSIKDKMALRVNI